MLTALWGSEGYGESPQLGGQADRGENEGLGVRHSLRRPSRRRPR